MSADNLFERDGRRLKIPARADFRNVGRAFTGWGTFIAIAFGILGAVGFMLIDAPLLGVIGTSVGVSAAGAAVVGILLWATHGRLTEVDEGARTIRFRSGATLAFDEVMAVQLVSYIFTQRTSDGTQESVRSQLLVLSREVDEEAQAIFNAVRHAIDESLADGGNPLTVEECAALQKRLDDVGPEVLGTGHLIADHRDELRLWRAAETLARLLDVPLLDCSGDRPLQRTPRELDMCLGERLARQEHPPEEPTGDSDGIQDRTSPAGFEVSWQGPPTAWSSMLVMFGIVVGVAAMIMLFAAALRPSLIAFAGTAALFVGAAVTKAVAKPQRLRVARPEKLTPSDIQYTTAFGRTISMPLARLEAVRPSTLLNKQVAMISDDVIIRCPMRSDAQVRWLARAVEHYVGTAYRNLSGGRYQRRR